MERNGEANKESYHHAWKNSKKEGNRGNWLEYRSQEALREPFMVAEGANK
jgi:hypothetical protein